ncbi:transcription initiation factor TFIID component TAF4 family-domain-containing protein [Epithele typhae]|uniref:transcription initiation factor TFIID component TAF4 family-domain-containing protein n=1 Tax=Epithele typhae TaxID=378194 RepID=UPI0020076D6B|nr:transcription initiation factor TFIID component TAF4 family-domain-containing protein [Epithele typhae]KAH9939305.1 transcription initiation factor TFIID component TAF4 family-domain-containing protein [Epithele typhae]
MSETPQPAPQPQPTPQPQAQPQPAAQPASTFAAAQWPQPARACSNTSSRFEDLSLLLSAIPIDPALQQQSQHPTHTAATTYSPYQYGHYPQSSYAHYPHYTQQAQVAQQAQTAQIAPSSSQVHTQVAQPAVAGVIRPISTPAAQAPAPTQPNTVETTDVATLNDALGSAGVDLKAEEETLQRTNDQYYAYRPYEDRSRKQPDKPQFDTSFLSATMRTTGTKYKVPNIPKDSVEYLALALRTRLQTLLTSMIAAAKHRTDTQFDRPPSTYEDGTPVWSIKVRADVGKQLEALQKAYREEDIKERRERKERQDAQAAQAAALTTGTNGAAGLDGLGGEGEDGAPKKKKKKDGPGVTARNMSADVQKKMSNAVASQAAGLGTGKYAWMSAASAGAAKPKPKPAGTPATTTTPATNTASGWARPYQSKMNAQSKEKDDDGRLAVTLQDAIFVVENEKGHGGGRGAAKYWT